MSMDNRAAPAHPEKGRQAMTAADCDDVLRLLAKLRAEYGHYSTGEGIDRELNAVARITEFVRGTVADSPQQSTPL